MEEMDYYDLLAEINEELKLAEEDLKILLSKENKWWSIGFAAQGKGNLLNEALDEFFMQVIEYFRKQRLKIQKAWLNYSKA